MRTLTAKGDEMLGDLPPYLHGDPDVRGVVDVLSREFERLDVLAANVAANLWPHTAGDWIHIWEAFLGLTVAPAGKTVADRQSIVITHLRSLNSSSGVDWIARVTELIGTSWEHIEHDPDQPVSSTNPPEYTLKITIPYAAGSAGAQQIETLIRSITPAHLDILMAYDQGFILGVSELGNEAFG